MNAKWYKCKYNDCGWCYCPADKKNNAQAGQCKAPIACPERERQIIARG